MSIKYAHTNIVAKDWRKLSEFYINVFECKPQYPERDLSGEWIDNLTNIPNVKVKGIHLSLPGYGDGPTLEIFSYEPDNLRNNEPKINLQGYGHIAFHVDEVEVVVQKLVEHGGKILGQIIKKDYEGIGLLTAAYAQDPEGNFIEIQNWSK
ncbi:glyoxalase-like domain protein [Desulfosporosinus acididurans]|uniref:Glyoxalase-like domain protein n=1 Tax=Desulfosporosinus acididurans TaxID=476652 RepID=A0A0J1IIA9_9FIRM|nr:VOC family protein [Desulfosporosinus acididurans]KLU64441.1 glyoxalase-like domain protein [Desulfosporosinus acididurans]